MGEYVHEPPVPPYGSPERGDLPCPKPFEIVTARCGQELCPNWSGDGNVCPCAVFGLPRPGVDP